MKGQHDTEDEIPFESPEYKKIMKLIRELEGMI
jgi:hypothetical protein